MFVHFHPQSCIEARLHAGVPPIADHCKSHPRSPQPCLLGKLLVFEILIIHIKQHFHCTLFLVGIQANFYSNIYYGFVFTVVPAGLPKIATQWVTFHHTGKTLSLTLCRLCIKKCLCSNNLFYWTRSN